EAVENDPPEPSVGVGAGEGGSASEPQASEAEQLAAAVGVVLGEELDTTSGETRMGMQGGVAEPGTKAEPWQIIAASVARAVLLDVALGFTGFGGRAFRKLKLNKLADRFDSWVSKLQDIRHQATPSSD